VPAGAPASGAGPAGWTGAFRRRSTVTLDQRRIFIFPSRTGFFFGLSLLVMLVAAINYQNNMAYALTFLLANLFVVAVLHSYANLSGLTITAVGAEDGFPGQRDGVSFAPALQRPPSRSHGPARSAGPYRRRSAVAGASWSACSPALKCSPPRSLTWRRVRSVSCACICP
jgi:hypothetical protein